MKVALTGGTGFVGSHLALALRAQGDEVACLVRSPLRAAFLRESSCRLVLGDLDSPEVLEQLARGAEVLYHVAGAIMARDEATFMRVNRDGTARVAQAARAAGVKRLVHVSSLSVTGPTRPGRPLDESGPPNPVTPYGRSKQAGESAVRESGVPFTIVRPPMVYGPRDRQLLPLFQLARRGFGPLLGDGTQELSLVHASDLARALLSAATSPQTNGGVYHAAGPEIVTQRQLLGAIGRAVGRGVRALPLSPRLVRLLLRIVGGAANLVGVETVLKPDKAEELLAPAWTCSSEALARDAGWRAQIPLEQGLVGTARWYRDEGWL